MVDQKGLDWKCNPKSCKNCNEIQNLYTQYKINKGEAITAVGSTAIIEAAYSEGVIGIAT